MRVKVEHVVDLGTVTLGILERWRVTGGYARHFRPAGRREAMTWVKGALRARGLSLWASVDDAPVDAREAAEKIALGLFPELAP